MFVILIKYFLLLSKFKGKDADISLPTFAEAPEPAAVIKYSHFKSPSVVIVGDCLKITELVSVLLKFLFDV